MICTDAENHVATVCDHPDPRHASKCEHGHGQIPRVRSYSRRWITVFSYSYRESNASKSTTLKSMAPKIHPSIAPAFPLLARTIFALVQVTGDRANAGSADGQSWSPMARCYLCDSWHSWMLFVALKCLISDRLTLSHLTLQS